MRSVCPCVEGRALMEDGKVDEDVWQNSERCKWLAKLSGLSVRLLLGNCRWEMTVV